MKAKHVLVAVVVVFVAVLAVIIGQRMSTDAMAVVIGVIFGVAASIPTSLLIVAVTRRAQEEREVYRGQAQPPVIVVNPGGGTVSPWFTPFGQPMLPPMMEGEPTRRFRVVGEEDGVLNAEPWPRRS